MRPTEPPKPTAQGDLARTPFAHLLLYCEQRKLGGTLAIWPEDPSHAPGQDRILLQDGVLVAAQLLHRAGALDRGLLPLFARASGPFAFYADVDLVGSGEGVRTGRVDPVRLVAASLRGPSRDDVVDAVLARFGNTPVRMKPGTDLKRFDPLPKEEAFFEIVRAAPAPVDDLVSHCELGERMGKRLVYLLVVTKSVEPWQEAKPSNGPGVAGAPSRSPGQASPARPTPSPSPAPREAAAAPSPPRSAASPTTPDTAALAEVLPLPQLDERKSSAPEPPRASTPPRRSRLEREPMPPPPAGLSAEHLALWNEIAARWVAIDKENYFEMLEVPRDAGADAIRKSYLAHVKKWHPDRVPAELAPAKPFVEKIFQLLTTACETLCDEKKRGVYLHNLSEGGGTPEADRKLAAVVQAAMEHQKAEVLLKRRDVEGAIALLEGALEMSPEDADIHASLAAAMLASTPPRDPAAILALAERAIVLKPTHDRAHHVRGLVLRKMGREAEAIRAFERAAELNPKNIDAVREVRLARMRGAAGPAAGAAASGPPEPKPGTDGFLAKLFGSGKKPSSKQP